MIESLKQVNYILIQKDYMVFHVISIPVILIYQVNAPRHESEWKLPGLAEITSSIHIVLDPRSSADTSLKNEEMPDLDNLDIS